MKGRVVVATGLLGAWGVGIALYAGRELSRTSSERLSEVALRVAPGVTWFTVERNGVPVGFASVSVDTVPRELLVTEYLVVDTVEPAAGRNVRLTEQTVVHLSRGMALRGYSTLRSVGTDTARVEGAIVNDSMLTHHAMHGGATDSTSAVLRGGAHFTPQLVPLVAMLRGSPEVGREAALNVVEPDSGLRRATIVRVAAESVFVVADSAFSRRGGEGGSLRWVAVHEDTVRAWHLTSSSAGHPLDVWVDALGRVVQARRADGLVLHRTAFELAFENWRLSHPAGAVAARADGGVVSATLLASGGQPPEQELDTLRVRVKGPTPFVSNFVRQYRAGNVLTVARAGPKALEPRYHFPTEERWRKAFAFNLRPERKVEIDAPIVARLAARLRGDERNPAVVVQRIREWVRDSMRADATVPEATAAQAISRRSGDVNEFARVVVALARAAGVPARSVAGLLHAGGRFYYHAWAEVYLGGWVSLDPMLAQMPADANHLTMRYESLDAEEELMRLVGRLDLTVVSRSPTPALVRQRP